MPIGKLKPNETWGRKRAKLRRFHISGPPRDIVGMRDMRDIDNYYQRDTIRGLLERDEQKFLGSKDEVPEKEQPLPPELRIPNNQPLKWYARKAMTSARLHYWGDAYWYFIWCIKKANTYSKGVRYEQSALANLKSWRGTL